MKKAARMAIATVACLALWHSCAEASDARSFKQCSVLDSVELPDLQDAPTQVLSAKVVEPTKDAPAHCQVDGYIRPQVGFQLRLPLDGWNEKLIVVGIGGWGGVISESACNTYLRRGYACIASDSGHKGRGADGLWAFNNLQAQIDFAYRGVHVTTLAGKAIIERFYSNRPRKAYFIGCSTGGYQGLVEAQKFPWDFNGIIAGAPDMDELDLTMRELWGAKNIKDASGHPMFSAADIQLLHAGALAQCDEDDGLRDGIISNPIACRFNPATLVCTGGRRTNCLTPDQVEAATRIYSGPPGSRGKTSVRGALPGSEMIWNDADLGLSVAGPVLGAGLFRYMVYGATPEWTTANFDFDRDYKRFGLGSLYSGTNPDLREFKSAGGKLLAYQGGIDVVEMPTAIVDYYETTQRTMGGAAATLDFFRLFMVPGMAHCTGGTGAYAIDYLSYLEDWAENGRAPESMVGAHVSESYLESTPSGEKDDADRSWTPQVRILSAISKLSLPLSPNVPVTFSRPVYPYPRYAIYAGKGNPNIAENFLPNQSPSTVVATVHSDVDMSRSSDSRHP
jgi:hypothetical protein